MMALMGGFVEVGETVDEAARRELQEEMNLELPGQPLSLLGVYSDPKRDKRKHSVSVVYSLDIPPHIQPNPGDDAKKVVRVALKDIDDMEVWIDHKTILHDFIKQRTTTQPAVRGTTVQLENDKEPFKRSICHHS
jgi:8-oxo-dGTP diphosphatase